MGHPVYLKKYKSDFRCEEKKVREVGNNDDDGIDETIKRCPTVDAEIAPLSHFIKTTSPSPLLKFGLLNALYPYVYCLRYFSGDVWSEANLRDCVTICITLSDNLRSDHREAFYTHYGL